MTTDPTVIARDSKSLPAYDTPFPARLIGPDPAGKLRTHNPDMETNAPELMHSTAALRPPLNRWEVRFCQLLVDGNSRYEAYTQAGFPEKRSRNAVDQAAMRLIKRVEIREYLRQLIQEALDAAQVTTNRVVQALARQAFADRRQLYDDKGCLLPPDQWPEDVASTVESIETVEVFDDAPPIRGEPPTKILRGYVRKVRTSRRGEALRQLTRYLRLGTAPAEPAYGPLVVIGEEYPGERVAINPPGPGS